MVKPNSSLSRSDVSYPSFTPTRATRKYPSQYANTIGPIIIYLAEISIGGSIFLKVEYSKRSSLMGLIVLASLEYFLAGTST